MNMVRLILFPDDAKSFVPDKKLLIDGLLTAGLIGAPSEHDANVYHPGSRFMTLLTFLGCSPNVSMAEDSSHDDDPNRYYVELAGPTQDISVLQDDRKFFPRCPQCGQTSSQWHSPLLSAESLHKCEKCGMQAKAHEWDWRRHLGFGRVWINIWGVHDGEAVPGEGFIDLLEKLTGFVWNYAYCRK
jgi:hypothetical protein